MRTTIAILIIAVAAAAQTRINGSRKILGTWDASQAASSKPIKSGLLAEMPAACEAREMYLATDAPHTRAIHICDEASGTWKPIGIGLGPTPPYSCQAGEAWIDTDATAGQRFLVAPISGNPCNWEVQGGGSGANGAFAWSSRWGTTFPSGTDAYVTVTGYISSTATFTSRSTIVPMNGTIDNLYFTAGSAQPSGCALKITLSKNNVDTALSVTIPGDGAAGTWSNTTATVVVSPGDLLAYHIQNGTCTSAGVGSLAIRVRPN